MNAPIMPLAGGQVVILLVQIASLLLLGLGLGRLVARFGLPPIVGELMAGVVLGPSLLGHAVPAVHDWLFPADPAQMHLLDAVAQIGVLLLVGVAGIELDTRIVRRRGTSAVRISLGGLAIPIGFGILIGYLAPAVLIPDTTERPVFALFLAVAMCVTAIPVIAKTLADMKLIHRDVGQLIMTSGMVDDAVGWFLLSVVSAMATVGVRANQVALSLLLLVAFVVAAIVVGRPLVRGALRLAGRSTETGPTIVTAVIIVLAGAAITQSLHMEAVFGAFVAGILVGHAVRERRAVLAPLRTIVLTVLAPIFLASAGLRMDLGVLLDRDVAIAAIVVLAAAILGKFTGAYLGARSSRLGHWESLAVGAGMNARGVVEIVVAMVGLRLGVLDIATFTIIALVAIVTSMMAPPLLRLAMSRVAHSADELLRKADHEEQWSTGPVVRPAGTGAPPAA
ncbi:cation:proton antiporter [Micromonospora sp. NPDC049102]|uniref:cation:proton antiporter n=1 Tax=Micromonospora sp. NPDC049102 TaxID=3364265 RepID=UPI0037209651